MLNKIRTLEASARRLDPGPQEREQLLNTATAYAEDLLQAIPGAKTYVKDDSREGLLDLPFGEEPTHLEQLLTQYRREVDTTGILPASGGQMGYIPGGGLFPSALGDFLAAISNRYSARTSPGPARPKWKAPWCAGSAMS